MARVYDVVCLRCGEIMEWCKYDPPFNRCLFCGARLTGRSGDWDCGRVRVFGVGSTGGEVHELSRRTRVSFFRERGGRYRFRLEDGRLCTVKVKEFPEFWLTLKAGGERVSLLYKNSALSEAAHLLRNYNFAPKDGLLMVEYRGARYFPQHEAVKSILKAIKENLKPEVAVLI